MPNEGLNKTIKDATVEIDSKILLIDKLLSKAQKGTESYNSLQSAKAELVSFKSKVSDEKNWKEADYIQKKEGDAKYLLKTGSIGGYTPEQYVKNLIEKIDYKSEKSPFKEIILDYNKGVSAESTKGVKSILNESVLGLTESKKNIDMPKDGDKYTLNGKIYTYKSDEDGWVRRENNAQGGQDGKVIKNDYFQTYIKEGNAQPLKTFKYSGVDYRYNPSDGKWYDKAGRAASEGITERINTLGKFDVKKEERSAEDIAKGGNFRLGIQDKKIPEAEKVLDQKAVAGTGLKPKNGTIVSRNGVEFRYQDGTWYPTKDKGWTANEKIAEELMQKWAAGDYKIWDNKANGYVKGDAPITGGLTGSAQGAAITKATENKIPEAEKVIEQKAVAGAGLTGGSAKTALAKTDKAVREAQTEAGVTPLKGNLTSPDNATPLAKASMADYFDMDAALAYNKMTPVKEGLNMDKLSSFSEYLPDVFKGALGLYGASQKLPEFETPQYFTDYERKLKELSTQGLTAEEMATAKRDLERTYAYDVNNIERFAGGRSGVALANLGRATNTYQGNTNALNVADAQMQRQNLAQYGGVVGTHLGLDQNAFNQKYQEAAQSKLAGAQLAADAFSNIQSRSDYNKAYGKGSVYDKYQTSLLQGQEYLNDIYKYQLDNPVPLPEYNPIIAPPTIPQYQNQYTNPNG